MRLASLPFVVLPLLLVDCGSRQDLFIGELFTHTDGGSGSTPSGGVGADATGGALTIAGVGGSADTGGSSELGGADTAGSAGSSGIEDCVTGDTPPVGSLIHRYSFEGTGTVATDSIGGSDGDIIGATLSGNGAVVMSGARGEYVDLPNGIISELTDVTVVTWTNWVDGAAYGRVFDFGSNENGEGEGTTGRSYMAVLPKTGFENQAKPGLGAEFKVPGFPTVQLASTENMKDRGAQISLVFQGGVSASLYIDSNLLATKPTAIKPSDIDDRNNWIGQSQYKDNPAYEGGFEEFRIYNVALNACQLHTLLVNGRESP